MDLSTLDIASQSEAGVEVEIVTPNGKSTGLFLTVVGRNSQVFTAASLEKSRRDAKLRKDKPEDITLDILAQLKASDRQFYAELVAGWRSKDGKVEINGKAVKFSAGTVVSLIQSAPYIADQIAAKSVDDSSFLPTLTDASSGSPDGSSD